MARISQMAGKELSSAMTYHEATKHSEVSIGTSAHYLDWDNKPAQFKEYKNLASVALPRNFPRPEKNSIKAIEGETKDAGVKQIDIGLLSELLFFSAGLTRKMRFGKEFHYMRAASATGALYPIELYVICGRIPDLEAGVYHFNPLHFSLAKLREETIEPHWIMQAALIACPHRSPWHSHHWHGGTHGSMKRDPIVTGSGTQELSPPTFSPPQTPPAFQPRLY